jgi:hypothetical protein
MFRYLPKRPVSYPSSSSQVATVEASWKASKPPSSPLFAYTPVVCE